MEKDTRDMGFEQYLRDQTDRHKVTPSEQVWLTIHQRMHRKSRWPNLVAALALFGLGVMTGLLLDENRTSEASQEKRLEPSSATESPKTATNTYDATTAIKGGAKKTDKTLAVRLPLENATPVPSYKERLDATHPMMDRPGTERQTVSLPFNDRFKDIGKSSGMDPAKKPAIGSLGSTAFNDRYPEKTLKNVENDRNRSTPSRPSPTAGKRKTALQVYFSPSISYRRLVGQATQSNIVYNGLPYSANLGFPTDVNQAVTHKPSIGMELGAAVAYPLTPNLRFKAGLQFNLNNYEIEAYDYTPEMAPLTAAGSPGYTRPINTVSYYRNFFGFSRTWLRNTHFMVSTPIGLELSVPAGRKVSVNLASTIQPTYTLRNNSYLISTNLKNYAQEPSLYRAWNVNAGAEAYVSVSKGTYRWIMGPQIRYQILSSYKDNYPISEHLIDYGMKFGVQKTIK